MLPDSPTAIFVLGVHRSGTSAFARIVNLLGAEIGPNLMLPVVGDNPRGFWEPRDVVDRHDELLAAFGRSWSDLRPLPTGWRQTPAGRDAFRDLAAIAAERFREAPLWLLKDPRLCLLLPLWLEVAAGLGHRAACVLVSRHPMEVVASLARRNAFSNGHALLLWLDHVFAAEEISRGRPRCFVTYDQVLSDWSAVVSRVGRELDISWPNVAVTVRSEVEGFLDPVLHHHRQRTVCVGVSDELADKTLAVFRCLEEASRSGEAASLGDELDGLRRDVDALRLGELEQTIETSRVGTETLRERAHALESALAESVRERNEQDGRTSVLLAAHSGDIAAEQEARRRLERQLTEAAERLGELDRETSAALGSAREETRRLERQLADAAEEFDDLARRVQQMSLSRSWRLTAPLRWLYDRTATLRALARSFR